MPTLNSKSEALALIKDDDFFKALMIDSTDEYDQQSDDFRDLYFEFHSSSFIEEAQGITLFRTAKKPIPGYGEQWGTWLTVSKQYDDSKTPYRVSANEYAPWGVEVDVENLGEYADLGEAFDYAFSIHESGSIKIHNLVWDEQNSRMARGDAIIDAPEIAERSDIGRLVSDAAQTLPLRRKAILAREKLQMEQQKEIYRLAWMSPVSLVDAKPIIEDVALRIGKACTDHYSDNMLAAATAIQEQLFAGQGKLLTYSCVDAVEMEHRGYSEIGTTFVVIEQAPGEFTFISPDCGIHDTAEAARVSVIEKLTEQYAGMKEEDNLYWDKNDGTLIELHIDQLTVTEAQPFVRDPAIVEELQEFGDESLESNGYRMSSLVNKASLNYRNALHQKIEADFRKREPVSGVEHELGF